MHMYRIGVVALAVTFAGCAGGANLVGLKRDYDRAWNQTPASSEQLLAIADQAQAVADHAKDTRTALSALAMGGLAAVKAGPAGFQKAINIGERGQRACTTLPSDQFGPPRDCALLSAVAELARWEQLAPRIVALRAQEQPPTGDLPASANAEVTRLDTDLASAWTGLNEATEKVLATQDVDDSVKAYLSGERLTAYCNYDTFLQLASNLPGTGAAPAPGYTAAKASFCSIRGRAPASVRDGKCPNKPTRFGDRACAAP